MKLHDLKNGPKTRTGPLAASALLIGAIALTSMTASAQQALPEAQPLDQQPSAEGRQPGQQGPQAQQQQGQPQQSQTQQGQSQQGQSQQGQSQQAQLQQAQRNPNIDPRAKNGPEGLYDARVADLRDSPVVDMAGASIGYVQDIVVKQDNSEAGLVISTGGQQEYVYVPLTDVRLEGEQLLLTSKVSPAPVSERELRDRNFNEVPDTDRPLSDYIQSREQGGSR